MKLYNTLTKKIEEFQPLNPPTITYYTCGPTVYDYTHLGHMRTYINNDILRRVLQFHGYTVKQVMNITDVGHLTDDADAGEDKLEAGAKKQKKTVWEAAEFFTDYFFSTMDQLNICRPEIICRATDHIKEMIQLINQLKQKGYLYETEEAVYFDTKKFASYGRLNPQKLEAKLSGARQEVHLDPQKKQPSDFAVWFKRIGRFADHTMHWDSPWGDGFPGWHIECSAMSMKYLGETIDIHAGGVDHIPVHHENEIAQSEAATGKPFVRSWFHSEFLLVNGQKMSKSLNNFYTIDDIKKNQIDPLAIRYLFLQSHYRTQMNFTWESAQASQAGYFNLKNNVSSLRQQTQRQSLSVEKLGRLDEYRQQFNQVIFTDLQLPQALVVVNELLKSNIPSRDKYELLLEFDQVLGLRLDENLETTIPTEIIQLAEKRKAAREKKDFQNADVLRKKIQELGYNVEDSNGTYILKKTS